MFRAEEWHIVPEWKYEGFGNDLLDPVLDLAKNDIVRDLPGANDRFNGHLNLRHMLEGEPDTVARRRLDLEQQMTLELPHHDG
jgi:hypothetical protein